MHSFRLISCAFFLAIVPKLCLAQHCGFDFESVVVVQPYESGLGGAVVPDLRIRLIDRESTTETDGKFRAFYRNDTSILPKALLDYYTRIPDYSNRWAYVPQPADAPPWTETIMFGFARDNYVCVFPSRGDSLPLIVQIVDTFQTRPGGRFRQKQIEIPASQTYWLCTSHVWGRIREVYIPLERAE